MRDKRIYKATDGSEWTRSRWLKVRRDWFEKPNPRHGLYDYMVDMDGLALYDERCDLSAGVEVEYFKYHGMRFPLSRFYALRCAVISTAPYEIVEDDGSSSFISCVDMDGDIFNPLYLELDEWGEGVRVYERV